MPRRLVVCFDGTWNTPDQGDELEQKETNACRFFEAVRDEESGAPDQLKWYDQGVGTNWYDRIPGGVMGVGLSENIRQGYTFLSRNHREGDAIYLLGFSRGAYTARSLVGMIRNCGLLKRYSKERVHEAYEIYRTRDEGPDSEVARVFREKYTRPVRIAFLGVWDTVGALGVPLRSFAAFNRRFYEFHDTRLSGIVERAYHAVAVDEHREDYDVTLWDPVEKPRQTVEQRWFVGAHADVGGGYEDRHLSDITLRWMQDKAQACGLEIDPEGIPRVAEDNCMAALRDSFKEFLAGMYGLFKDRYYRRVAATVYGNEAVDATVRQRAEGDGSYRPKNAGLAEYLWPKRQ